ncbi:MFS general substrate transporter [Schizophyllum commune H4-8]|uniref:MFS general substrate transporter n=1 Tax=Schizophyllum commune (strain H4-8 / FGSC 9210) TaxID=578458 RepID=UPI00215EE5B7|nr:MFS general substrate transporter [Schizophyllum commune H4-8]KAI5887604.1 MFS general substrate transporter [Schizophyllum commune H4-8]
MSTGVQETYNDEKAAVVDDRPIGGDVAKRTHVVALQGLYEDGAIDAVYKKKAQILNQAIQEIGMGKYQYLLFITAGFGWFADSVWPLLTGLILTPVVAEFGFTPSYLTLAANIGLLVGAAFWGFGCDVFGRRWAFNLTLLITGAFGLAAGGSDRFVTLASLLAVVGVGVGGNMPVDSALFLDLVPGTHQYLLTVMTVFWSLGQLFASMIAWPLIANFSCSTSSSTCTRASNMGWRYLLFTLGGTTLVLWAVRFFAFRMFESPRYLVGKGRDAEAVKVIHDIARYNGTEATLTVAELEGVRAKGDEEKGGAGGVIDGETKAHEPVLTRTSVFRMEHMRGLFATPKIALSTSLLVVLWGLIGLASTLYNSFLPFILQNRGNVYGDGSLYTTYRNNAILAVIGIPAAFLAGYLVELPRVGRKGTLALFSWLTGAFLLGSTTARSSGQLLGWNCGYTFSSNIMYGVLYAISPEIFPAKDRGTGNALVSTTTRVFGVVAPVIALFADITTAVPVYVSGAIIIACGGIALLLPYEPRGKASI